MLKNFALIHFCYYTVGSDDFLAGIKRRLTVSRALPESLEDIFTNSGDARAAVKFTSEKLLPYAKWVPDLILKGSILYRNTDSVPDISVKVDGEIREIQWNGKRLIDLGVTNGVIIADPYHLVPQLDFLNDKSMINPELQKTAEWNSVVQAVIRHRHYEGESLRNIMDIKMLAMPANNAFGADKGITAYIATVHFIAPVNGKLMEGLKDMVLTVGTNAKVMVLGDRIRF
jgi:hypothetical protein